ncbi:MAG: hypothetical protein Q8N63_04100 [Nanoarchaeota archaeon]|nr:hypothetical protein [Nanoarchaeota archaeon]
MEKIYYFDLKLELNNGNPFLSIKPRSYFKKEIPYPINFRELNVPIKINKYPVNDASELEYFLDFEGSFNGEGEQSNPFNRNNLIRVLSDLEKTIDEDLKKALCRESKLNKKVKVISDNGLEANNKRYGNPKSSKNSNAPIKRKRLTYF